ncbi:RodZ domain-containing protein [Aeromonas sp. BIGb0445]|uniref:RodZ domain-containing protein n=1 Tax=Aeromonas sp. BIGb0445 TaxID=2940593 RepID=UPI0021680F1C|nr:RodZ domain-containing protein [Aeromonas sp. BIGb0445]MCS3460071.1 cytoskeleton protein RodZ [Aeromonas sp. BIGb0445]
MTIEQQHDSQDESQAAGPGQLLRAAREQLGWTREQVASRLHLRLTLIAAIESDTYDKNTSHTFIRGYLRTYAKLVSVPEETVLAAYTKLGLTPPDNIDMQSFSRRSRQQANDSRLKLVTWLVILALIGLSVAWWWQSTAKRSAGEDALAASEISAPAEPQVATDVNEATQGELPVAETAPVAEVEPAAPAVDQNTTASAAVNTAPVEEIVVSDAVATVPDSATEPATSVPQLKLNFAADCWLDVKDSTGKTLFSGLKKANDELTLAGTAPFKFIIGAPMAVKIEFEGKSIDMSRYNNGRTAKFALPQE